MARYKWHLITELESEGLLMLMADLDRLYHEIGEWGNAPMHFRIRDDKYDVNILTKDYEAMKSRVIDAKFESRYKEGKK